MPFYVVAAAAAIALAVPVLWWSVAIARNSQRTGAVNLNRGLSTDLRELMLARGAADRSVRPAVAALARRARRLTPVGWLESLEHKVVLAGRPAAWPLERVLAAKLVTAAGLGLLSLLPAGGLELARAGLLVTVAVVLGFYLPDAILGMRGRERQRLIQMKLPDTLDQMTICVEAGLGFEAAMARTGRSGEGPLADELIRTLQEMQIGATRKQALKGLAERTNVVELRRFVLALLQAEAHGLPLADVLRVQASELRIKRRQRAEEHAMKIPVKVVFPLVVCILPALFIVVLGPGGLRMIRFLTGGGP